MTLESRGIAKAAELMGWTPAKYGGSDGWAYPVKNLAGEVLTRRWKAKPGTKLGTPKYCWFDGSKPEDTGNYYYAPGVKAAMGGSIYMTAGEPDVLVMMSAGIDRAFCTTLSEGIYPTEFITLLQYLEIEELKYAPDLDTAGMKAAVKLRDLLRGSGIKLTLYRLPGEITDKDGVDLNKIWIDCKFNKSEFKIATMTRMEDSELLPYVEVRPAHHPKPIRDSSLPEKFLRAIEVEIETKTGHGLKFGRDGWSQNFTCITGTHADVHPSAGWNKDGAYNCFVCGTMNSRETGAMLGLNIRDYFDDEDTLKIVTLPQKPVSLPEQKPESRLAQMKQVIEQVEQAQAETDQLYHDGNAELTEYLRFIYGEKELLGRPVLFPFQNLRKFGGFCSVLMTGKVVIIGGESASGKTILLETMSDRFCEAGIGNVFVSKEWKNKELSGRRVGRYSVDYPFTLADAMEYAVNGRTLSKDKQEALALVCRQLRVLPGKVYYFENKTNDGRRFYLEDMLANLTGFILNKRKAGERVDVVLWDYVQLYPLRKFTPGASNIEEAKLELFKAYCTIMDVIGITTSQVTKAASDRIRGQGQKRSGGWLHLTDCQYLREDKANLGLMWQPRYYTAGQMKLKMSEEEWVRVIARDDTYTINPHYIFHDERGKPVKTGEALLLVEKNSLQNVDNAWGIYNMDWKHMRVVENGHDVKPAATNIASLKSD